MQTLVFSTKICRRGHGEYDAARRKCPSCCIEYSRSYYQKNRDRLKAEQAKRRSSNLEAIREYDRNRPNQLERLEAKRTYWEMHRDEISARNKAWRDRNPERAIYCKMRRRCLNPKDSGYKNYGGRGISVCQRWQGQNGFNNFLQDMGPRPSAEYSLERKNVNGNYEPENCKWATREEQAGNKRTSVRISYNGKVQCLRSWARELGIRPATLYSRLRIQGWNVEQAFSDVRNLTSPRFDELMKVECGKNVAKRLASILPRCNHLGWSARCFRCAEKAFIALAEMEGHAAS